MCQAASQALGLRCEGPDFSMRGSGRVVEGGPIDPPPGEGPGQTLVDLLDLRRTAEDGNVKIPETVLLCQGHKEALTHIHRFLADLQHLFLPPPSPQ